MMHPISKQHYARSQHVAALIARSGHSPPEGNSSSLKHARLTIFILLAILIGLSVLALAAGMFGPRLLRKYRKRQVEKRVNPGRHFNAWNSRCTSTSNGKGITPTQDVEIGTLPACPVGSKPAMPTYAAMPAAPKHVHYPDREDQNLFATGDGKEDYVSEKQFTPQYQEAYGAFGITTNASKTAKSKSESERIAGRVGNYCNLEAADR